MNAMLKIARIYDARPLPVSSLLDVIRVAERTALSLRGRTTRTLRWWPWAKLPPMGEAQMVMATCHAAAERDEFGDDETAFLRILVFHRLYGGPVADRLHDLLEIDPSLFPEARRIAQVLNARPSRRPTRPARASGHAPRNTATFRIAA